MIKKCFEKDSRKWIVSGFNDISQEKNLIKVGFENRIFKVFNTELEADAYLKEVLKNDNRR